MKKQFPGRKPNLRTPKEHEARGATQKRTWSKTPDRTFSQSEDRPKTYSPRNITAPADRFRKTFSNDRPAYQEREQSDHDQYVRPSSYAKKPFAGKKPNFRTSNERDARGATPQRTWSKTPDRPSSYAEERPRSFAPRKFSAAPEGLRRTFSNDRPAYQEREQSEDDHAPRSPKPRSKKQTKGRRPNLSAGRDRATPASTNKRPWNKTSERTFGYSEERPRSSAPADQFRETVSAQLAHKKGAQNEHGQQHKKFLQVGQKNQNYRLTIESLGENGEGLGQLQDLPVFVPGGLPGETVEVKIIKRQQSYAIGKVIKQFNLSNQRSKAACALFGRCGGCQLQHLVYPAQLTYKTTKLRQSFAKYPELSRATILDTLPAPMLWHYRNKAQLALQESRKNGLQIGLYARHSHQVVDTTSCPIQLTSLPRLISAFRRFAAASNLSIYDEVSHTGLLRYLTMRATQTEPSQIIVTVVINGSELPKADLLLQLLQDAAGAELIGLTLNFNKQAGDTVFGPNSQILWGQDTLTEEIGGLSFQYGATAFFQVNPAQTQNLVALVREAAGLTGQEIIWDAYCGSGLFALSCAGQAQKVVGIELDQHAVNAARANAELNQITNATFLAGAAENIFPELISRDQKPDVIILDPPRQGCQPALLAAIVKAAPSRLVYISCHPTTLARDLAILLQQGFRLIQVQPLDMFAQSSHVESVSLLEYS